MLEVEGEEGGEERDEVEEVRAVLLGRWEGADGVVWRDREENEWLIGELEVD